MPSKDPHALALSSFLEPEAGETEEHMATTASVLKDFAGTGNFMTAGRRRSRDMFSRKNIGGEPQKCEKCGSDKVFFVQHSHGNYPILDYVCPKCDLGGDQGVPDWYMSPTGEDNSSER